MAEHILFAKRVYELKSNCIKKGGSQMCQDSESSPVSDGVDGVFHLGFVVLGTDEDLKKSSLRSFILSSPSSLLSSILQDGSFDAIQEIAL